MADPTPDPAETTATTSTPERLEAPAEGEEGLNWRLVIGVLVTAAVLGYLVIDGLGSETYFFTVDEAIAQAKSVTGETIRVKGTVVEGSIEGEKGEVGRSFEISEKGETIRIEYDQAMPDTFKEGVQVVATGTLESEDRLVAREVLVKCPSRYEGKPPTAHEGEGPRAER